MSIHDNEKDLSKGGGCSEGNISDTNTSKQEYQQCKRRANQGQAWTCSSLDIILSNIAQSPVADMLHAVIRIINI